MKNRLQEREAHRLPSATKFRAVVATLMLLLLGSCASQAAKDVEIAVVEAERVALEQEAAQVVADQERARAAQLQLQTDRAAAQRGRASEATERRVAEARARDETERQEQEAREQAQRERSAAIAAAEAGKQDRLDRITELEQQIASIETGRGEEASRVAMLTRAVETAEELLTTLAEEQAKYPNTDEQGNTVEPLAKELIAELESRKNELVRQANSP
jgi:hypothetical protein